VSAQIQHYEDKLAYEIDSWDLSVALEGGENVVVIDARGPHAYEREHIPGHPIHDRPSHAAACGCN
jgi:rhodanese-related sulfurtransferase